MDWTTAMLWGDEDDPEITAPSHNLQQQQNNLPFQWPFFVWLGPLLPKTTRKDMKEKDEEYGMK